MRTRIGRIVVTSTLMVLFNRTFVNFAGPAGITAADPTLAHVSPSPAADSARFVPGLDQQFLSSIPTSFVLPTPDDELGTRLLAEYGAVLVAGDGVATAPRALFADQEAVARFQRTLETSEGAWRLQSPAARALAAAQEHAKGEGLSISARDADSAARDFQHTFVLWKRRVDSALKHWVTKGRIGKAAAARLRSLPPLEQTAEILRLEREGLFFSPGFAKSILSSVAPPGASQHLALLAFDVREHRDARVRQILEEHGWYQTVLQDAPHFTYLGVPRARLESLGLTMIKDGKREYWMPRRMPSAEGTMSRATHDAPGISPAVGHEPPAQSPEIFGYSAKGRRLAAYVLGNGPNVTMIFGAFHQDEPASAEMVEALRSHLTANLRQLKGNTVVLVPETNPDGAPLHERRNANGVDLNRNFPGTWSSISFGSRYCPGPAVASEPETRAVMHLVEKYAPSKVISIHQPLRCVNWDGEAGQALAEGMSLHNGYPTKPDIGYPTPGSFGTYCAGKGIAAVTLEMPSAAFATCWRENKEALMAAIRMEVPQTNRAR